MSVPKWQSLQQSADLKRKSADHAVAVELYTKAMASKSVPWEACVDMSLACADSYKMLGQLQKADDCLSELAEKARLRGDEATIIRAYADLIFVHRKTGEIKRGKELAQQALDIANRVGAPDLRAEALLTMGMVHSETGQPLEAETCAAEALSLINPEDKIKLIKWHFIHDSILGNSGKYQELLPSNAQAVELARSIGDHDWEGMLLNQLAVSTVDLAAARSLLDQALVAFQAAGDLPYQALVTYNINFRLNELGLYRRVIKTTLPLIELNHSMGADLQNVPVLLILGVSSFFLGETLEAYRYFTEGIELARKAGTTDWEFVHLGWMSFSHALLHEPKAAFDYMQKMTDLPRTPDEFEPVMFSSMRAIAHATAGDFTAAHMEADQALSLMDGLSGEVRMLGRNENGCYLSYRALVAANNAVSADKINFQKAWHALEMGIQSLLIPVRNLSDAGLKRGYLHRNLIRRFLILEWLKLADSNGVTAEEMASFINQVQKPGRLDEVFNRLLKVGVRLNAERDPALLPDEIVEEVDELTGAERIALVLLDEQGKRKLIKTLLPRPPFPSITEQTEVAPDPQAFLEEIEVWLQQAIDTHQGFIRQLNPGAGLTQQLSVLVTPLISQGRLVGVIYCDLRGCFGRFDPEDLNLLGVLANQSAVAVENADWSATLEQKVEQRTEELKQSNVHLEQRNSELAVINSIQQGLAAQLDIQGIFDLVGDKIRQIFDPQMVLIDTLDFETGTVTNHYFIEKGQRYYPESRPLFKLHKLMQQTYNMVLINRDAQSRMTELGIPVPSGTEAPKSAVFVPWLVGENLRGVISLQNIDREAAFEDSSVHLLMMIANSMSVALENARLFDETQRLVKAEQARVAELEIINSIQQGLAKELDFQAVVDLVGDKLQEVLHTGDLGIRWYEEKENLLHHLYASEHGKRMKIRPGAPLPGGVFEQIRQSRKPMIANTQEYYESISTHIPGTDYAKSGIAVPIISSDKVLGIITIDNYEREYAFGESEVRLLTTIAGSLGSALENARLFDETQRLVKAEQARVGELEIINSIQQGLAKELDFQAIVDLVGDKLSEVLHTDNLGIWWYEEKVNLLHFLYDFEHGKRLIRLPVTPKPGSVPQGPIVKNTVEELLKGEHVPGTDRAKSMVTIPIIVSDRVIGAIHDENFEREYAYGASELRLLTTIAGSLGSALENARLFDETQRLLKETEQRNAELAIINEIQRGLASKLNMQEIYDLVCNKVRETFSADVVALILYDEKANITSIPHMFDHGERYYPTPEPLNPRLLSLWKTREPLLLGTYKEVEQLMAKYGLKNIGGPTQDNSFLYVPIFTGEKFVGVITIAKLAEHAFNDSDVRLLQTLVNSMSVALENARLFDETQRLVKAEQERVGELEIINSIQQGLAKELNFQAIIDLVGDKLREVLNTGDMGIIWYDEKNDLNHYLYSYEHGKRLTIRPMHPVPGGAFEQIRKLHQMMVANTPADLEGVTQHIEGTDYSKSAIIVPIISSDRVLGIISVENYEREYAFQEPEQRLLTTISASLGTALENARLFEETQRLLKETEQRNAELAVINTVQAALSAELNIQGIYDAVGDKIREIFHSDNVAIRIYDPKTNLLSYPYQYEKGVQIPMEPEPLPKKGFSAHVIRTRETIVINEDFEKVAEKYGGYAIPGTLVDKSAVLVPLVVGDQARGLVYLADYEHEHAFSESDVRLLQTLVNSMSVALENARLFDETQRLVKAEQARVAELEIINSIQQGLAKELDFQAIVDLVGDKLREVMHVDNIGITWWDAKANLVHYLYTYELGKRISAPTASPRAGGIYENLMKNRQPIIQGQVEQADQALVPGTMPSVSSVYIPIISGDRFLGDISLEDFERKDAFGESEIRLLTTIAVSLGTALENARLFDETQLLLAETEQRNSELAIINSVQAALAAELNIQGIYDAVGDKIREIFHSDNLEIRIYDPKTNLVATPYLYEKNQRIVTEPILLSKKGFSAHILRTKETLVINENMQDMMEKFGSYVLPGTQLDKSSVMVPIIVGGQARGLVCLSDFEKEHAFGESDVRLLQTLVNSMSVALENARLFDETQRLLAETEQRNSELAIINSVQAALAAELNIQGIYDAVGDKIREIFHSDNLEIRVFDARTDTELIPYLYEKGERIIQEPSPRDNKGIAAHIAETRETLVINENMRSVVDRLGSYIVPGTGEPKSAVYVPLIVGDQVRGLVGLTDFEAENAFQDSDVRLLQTLVNSMSVALENARLFNETQRLLEETSQRASELAIINNVSQAMSSQLQVEAIVCSVGDQVRDTLHSEVVNIYLYDAESGMIRLPYSYDRKPVISEPFPYGSGLTSKIIDSKQPLILDSFEEIVAAGALLNPNDPGDEQMPQSYMGVPIIVGERAIGAIDVQSYTRFVYGESQVRLLSTLAASMGVALENARLFEETRRLLAETEQRNRELAIISRIGQALAGQLDPQGIFDLVGEELRQIFDAQVVAIITYDRMEDQLHYRYLIEKGQRAEVLPRPRSGLAGHILKTRQPLLITHDLDKWAVEFGSTIVTGEAPKSYLGVPLVAGGEATGIISLQNIDREDVFTENDLRLLSTLALNMGVALENARLYQETQRHAVEMAALAEIGSDIASTHEMEPVLERMATKTRELMQVRDIALYLLQPDGHTLRAIVSQGKYAEQTKAQEITIGEGISGSIVASGVAEIVNYPEKDPRAIHITGTPAVDEEFEGFMVAPLMSRGRTMGVMSVYRDRTQGLFTQLELDFLVSLARQAAIAIDSAQLYAETERRATEMAALAEVSREISATLELQVVLERIAAQARELLEAAASAVYLLQPDGQSIKAIASEGDIANEVLADEGVQIGRGIIGSIVLSGVAEWVNDTVKDPRVEQIPGTQDTLEGEKLLVAPLQIQDQAIGALAVWRNPADPPFNQAELSFAISLAQQTVVAIENARLFETAQESQRRMADIINFLPDSTFVIDRQGTVIAWNHAIEEMTGVKAEEIIGKNEYEYAIPFYGKRRPILIDMVLKTDEDIEKKYTHLQSGENILVGEAISTLRGRTTYLNATASALRNSKGEVVGAIESIRDITDQKMGEEELKQAKLEAEAANQAKSAFLAMMSHEIRTPMNAIIGMSGLLMDTALSPDQREFAETIRSSGDSLLTIINDILDFSKIEAGKMTLEEAPFDLRECVEAALDLIKVRASEKGIELVYQMDPGVPPAIMGDVTRLRQVFINLLANSVKFTEHGEIVLTASKGEQEGSLHFSVHDTGIGIPPDRISLLFRAFTQADASTSRRYGGTGLGLALSSRIVDLMGGKMWAESEGIPGKGSTFHFIIFAKPALDWKGRPHLLGEQEKLRGKRLLVVDDNATNLRILELQARAWGMLPVECSTSEEVLDILRKGDRFDVAILDMQMPEMSGVELAAEIRKLEASQPGSPQLPLILSTSLGGREEARDAKDFTSILMKPIRQSALYDTLMTLFAGQTGGPAKRAADQSAIDPEMGNRHPLRILLAEDNVVNQKLALRLLSQMGYRADMAANGLEVLQAVKRQPYDVILMDVQMPEMDGLEATRRLCADITVGKRPRIIAMTANAMQGDREMCLEAGMDDYLSKPIRVEELVNALYMAKSSSNG